MTYEYEPHDDWYECTIDDACTIASLMGWDISPRDVQFRGFWSQGDGASFTGTLGYKAGCAKAVKAYAPQDTTLHDIAQRWQALQSRNFYKLHATAYRTSSHYAHENTVSVECEHADDSYRGLPDGTCETALDIARDFMRWIYNSLEREYEYQRAWNMAQAWQDAAQAAHDSRADARQAVADYRATLASPCAPRLPASTLKHSKAAIRNALQEYSDACERFERIGDEFAYWQDRSRMDIVEFAREHL